MLLWIFIYHLHHLVIFLVLSETAEFVYILHTILLKVVKRGVAPLYLLI